MKRTYLSCLKKSSKILRNVDIFGAPITLNFEGESQYKTYFGGTITILILIFLMIVFYPQIVTYIEMTTVTVESEQSYNSSPQLLKLEKNNFLFALRISQTDDNFAEVPYFVVTVTQTNQTRSQGITQKVKSDIQLEPCKKQYFEQFNNEAILRSFEENSFQNSLCPTMDSIIYLQGAYLNNDQFSYIKFSVIPCQGFTNSSSWNVTCAPTTTVDEYYNANGYFQLSIYTSNFVTNSQQASNYTQAFMKEDLTFMFQPTEIIESINVFFQEEIVHTDVSTWIDNQIIEKKFIKRTDSYQSQQYHRNIATQNDPPIEVFFRRDYITYNTKRSFMKIDVLLAYFGGIFNIVYIIAGFFIRYYNFITMKLHIAKGLFDFINDKSVNDSQHQQLHVNICQNMLPDDYYGQPEVELQNEQQIPYTSLQQLQNKFNNLLDKYNVKITIKYWIYQISQFTCYKTTDNQLLSKGLELVNQSLNIKELLRSTQEVVKLKQLLLNQSQQKLFQIIPKPQIQLKCKQLNYTITNLRRNINKGNTMENERTFNDLAKAYKTIWKSTTSNDSMEDTISRNLLLLIDSQLQSVLHQGLVGEDVVIKQPFYHSQHSGEQPSREPQSAVVMNKNVNQQF